MMKQTITALILVLVWMTSPSDGSGTAGTIGHRRSLEKNLNNPKVRVAEVSMETGLFERGHVPNAQDVVWHTALVDTVRRDIATQEEFEQLARKLGIEKDAAVVLYSDNNNWFPRGHIDSQELQLRERQAAGRRRKKWEADKRPLDTRVTSISPSRSRSPRPMPSCAPGSST